MPNNSATAYWQGHTENHSSGKTIQAQKKQLTQINQSINQLKHIYTAPYVTSKSKVHDDGN